MFRIANVKRNNGKHKVPLTLEEVRDLPYYELIKLGDAPRTIEPAVEAWQLEPVEDLAEAYKRAKTEVHKELEEAKKRRLLHFPKMTSSTFPKKYRPA